MIILEGNLLDTSFQLIAHQVNCKGIMGAGLAKQIKQKYPMVYERYKDHCQRGAYLGDCVGCDTPDHHYIMNIFAQSGYGRDKVYTDYGAMYQSFRRGISEFRERACEGRYIAQLTIAIPYGIGCGLAGGNWEKVMEVLKKIEKDQNVMFVAYCL